MAATIRGKIYRVGQGQFIAHRRVGNEWLLNIPWQVVQALNHSSGDSGTFSSEVLYGTHFGHNRTVSIYLVGQGTWDGTLGSSWGIFIGTGVSK